MMSRTSLAFGLVVLASVSVASCATPDANTTVASPNNTTAANQPAAVRDLPNAGPQSYTPETKPKPRTRALTQLWTTHVGGTDHRSTVIVESGTIYVGTREGVVSVDAKTGTRKGVLPAARGAVVGVAMGGDVIYSSSAGGELVAASRTTGAVVSRAELGAPATTPPTLLDVDGDGTFEVAVGDAKGRVSLYDSKTGKRRWSQAVGTISSEPRVAIGAGLATADLDGDGVPEIVAGSENGSLVALRGKTGDTLWTVKRTSALRAAPVLSDIDADKQLEVIVGWADGDIAIVDGKTGREHWSTHVEEDDGDPTGVLASPMPLPGSRVGRIVVPTARWGKEDCVILIDKHDRSHQSQQGRVVTSPVLGTVEPDNGVEAVIGTAEGDVLSYDATGGYAFMYRLKTGVTAPITFADLKGDGTQNLLVLSADGNLTALALKVAVPPFAGRSRGSVKNDGVVPPVDLGWQLH